MITINANLREPIFLRHAGEENALRVAFDLQEFEAHWPGGVPALLVRRPISSMDAAAYPVPLSVDGRTAFWTVSASDTECSGYGKAQLQWRVGGTLAKSCVYDTVCAPSLLAGDAPPDAPSKAWFEAIQGQIGDLSKLTTKAKENLVAAINEAARTGGGSGGAGPIDMRVANGYIQYSNDGGETWENLITVEDLKGDKGETGPKGEQGPKGDPGAKGADGITPTIGANGNWYLGDEDTGKPSRGEKGDPGAKGADGAAGKDGYSPEATVTPINGGAKIIIKDRNGTTSANVMNGAQGPQGPKGDPGATDLSLGITGAQVGQIAKITAVDTDGKPTKWEPVEMASGGGGETWELIAEIDFDVDAANDVSVWEYKNLPNYKELAYRKVSLVGSTETESGLSIAINDGDTHYSSIKYAKKGGQSNGWGEILLLPFGWIHVNSGSANLPTNYATGGVQAIYNAIPVDGDSITSVRLSSHTTYKIAGGKLSLYGRR